MPLQRILITVHHYPPRRVGGAELVARRLAQWLSSHGVEVRVVCVENLARGPITKMEFVDECDGAVQVRRLDLTIAENLDLALWHNSPLLRAHLIELLTDWSPQLVHAMSGYLMGTAPTRRGSIPQIADRRHTSRFLVSLSNDPATAR